MKAAIEVVVVLLPLASIECFSTAQLNAATAQKAKLKH